MKLRLLSTEGHQKVADLLASQHKASHLQENIFFDGTKGELSSNKSVLRLRFYGGDANKCVASLKGKARLVDGISTVTEEEEEIADVGSARACITQPSQLPNLDCTLIQRVCKDFQIQDFVCFGGFRNVRNVFLWEGLTLELDETQFDFGTLYEIECETTDPHRARALLEEFLHHHGIPFSYSVMSKFAIFRSGKLPAMV